MAKKTTGPSAVNFSLNDLFGSQTLAEVPAPHSGLVTIDSAMSVATVMAILHKHQINAAPVLAAHNGKDKFVGIVDLAKLTEFVLNEAAKSSKPIQETSSVLEQNDVFAQTPVAGLLR